MRKSYSRHINYLLDTSLQTVGDIDGEDEPVTFEIYARQLNKARKHSPYFNRLHDRMFELRHISSDYKIKGTRTHNQFAINEQEAVELFLKKHPTRVVLSVDGKSVINQKL